MKKNILPLFVILAALISVGHLNAWTTAGLNPPADNVPAPINTSASDQVKDGGISVGSLVAKDGLASIFYNTADGNSMTAWRVKRNDGTADFLQYWNTEGGTAPTRETAGFAFKQSYSVGSGDYTLYSASSSAAGTPIAWTEALRVGGDGTVHINNLSVNNFNGTSNDFAIELGMIRDESSGDILVANTKCMNMGFTGVWSVEDRAGAENIICFKSAQVSPLPMVADFVFQFSALNRDPDFRTWFAAQGGAALPSAATQYYNDYGWYRKSEAVRMKVSQDAICSFMMEDGSLVQRLATADYGSDNNNRFYYLNDDGTWGQYKHGDNGQIDVIFARCQGTAVSSKGEFWLRSNRTESTCGSYRCNPYPVPPANR